MQSRLPRRSCPLIEYADDIVCPAKGQREWDDRRTKPMRHADVTRNVCLSCWESLRKQISDMDNKVNEMLSESLEAATEG